MLYSVFGKILLVLLIVGGLNWGSIGIFGFDFVAFLCGGADSAISRVVYTLVGLAAIWGLNAVGWLLGGSLGWLARTVFIVVGVAALALIPALFAQAPHHSGPEEHRA